MESQLKHTADAIAQKRRSMAAIQLELDKQARRCCGEQGVGWGGHVGGCMAVAVDERGLGAVPGQSGPAAAFGCCRRRWEEPRSAPSLAACWRRWGAGPRTPGACWAAWRRRWRRWTGCGRRSMQASCAVAASQQWAPRARHGLCCSAADNGHHNVCLHPSSKGGGGGGGQRPHQQAANNPCPCP